MDEPERSPDPAGDDPLPPDVLKGFADVVRRRLGLAQAGRNREVLARRLRAALDLARVPAADAADFVRMLDAAEEGAASLLAVANAVPNRETSFFRDADQLGQIARDLLPDIAANREGTGPLRVLSVGCATGEEAYSMAILGFDQMHRLWGRSLVVTGVDVSPHAIDHAQEALYPATVLNRAGEGPAGWRTRYLRTEEGGIRVRDHVRAVTDFRRGNVVAPASLQGLPRFDVVLCRNLLIYFDSRTFLHAAEVLLDRVLPGGALVLGRAEAGIAVQLGMALDRVGELSVFRRRT